MPALDGLRALAVLAVLFYHAGQRWIPGGLLGVDAFFVLSGFLITGLLVRESLGTGRVDLVRFWVARARRLLPALLLLLTAMSGYATWIADPGDLGRLRADALSALAYVANWRFAVSHQGYFDHFSAPSPLLHLWSLGVEEQFYLLWPLAVAALLGRTGRLRLLLWVSALGALASSVLTITMAAAGVDSSRLYYGTDTRAQALLVGAALAVWTAAQRPSGPPKHRRLTAAAGDVGAGVVGSAWLTVNGTSTFLYFGGFLLIAIAVAAVVNSVSQLPEGLLARALSAGPLVYLGRISYGVYLWHWPAFLVLTEHRTGLGGSALLLTRLAVTFVLAAVSFHAVEQPLRRGELGVWRPRLIAPATAMLTVAAVLATTNGTASGRENTSLVQLAQRSQLQAFPQPEPAGAARVAGHAAQPVVLLVGDSVALTLGVGLTDVEKQYGVTVLNGGTSGCGVARWYPVTDGKQTWPAYDFCNQWPERWAAAITRLHPTVTAILVGRWETYDRLINGRWTHIGDPSFDAYLTAELERAISVLGGRGAPVVLLTTPAFLQRERPDGGSYSQDDPGRVARFNALLRAAAAAHPNAHVFDLASMLSPDGRFHRTLNGVEVRWADGIHIAQPGGHQVAVTLLPELRALSTTTAQHTSTSAGLRSS